VGQSDHDRRSLALRHACNGEGFGVLFSLDEFKVEHLSQVGEHDLEVAFSKCLSKANSLASTKRQPAHSVSFLARGSQVEWTSGVEALRQKLIWTVPLSWVLVQSPVQDANVVSFLHGQLVSQCDLLGERDWSDSSRGLESQTFTDNHIEVLQVKKGVDR